MGAHEDSRRYSLEAEKVHLNEALRVWWLEREEEQIQVLAAVRIKTSQPALLGTGGCWGER